MEKSVKEKLMGCPQRCAQRPHNTSFSWVSRVDRVNLLFDSIVNGEQDGLVAPGDATVGCLFAEPVANLTAAQDVFGRACIVAAKGALAITGARLLPTLQDTRSWR